MRKTMKTVAVAAAVISVSAVGAGIALASSSSSPRVATPTTTAVSPAAVAPETIAQEAESVTTTAAPVTPEGNVDVKLAQQRLRDAGYWMSAVDGKVGQSTQQAVLAFQKIHGLGRTGKLDVATATAIAGVTRPAAASTSGDLIEVDKAHQVIYIVRGGQTLWVLNTSTGTEKSYVTNGHKGFAHTPTGVFNVSRSVDAVDPGPLGPLYRPRYFTNTGIAIHGAGSIPAYPASHGCARVSNAAMDFIWANNLMPKGSQVWVYDDPAKQPYSAPAAPVTTTTAVAPLITLPPVTLAPAPPTTPVAPTTTTAAPTTTSTTSAGLVTVPRVR